MATKATLPIQIQCTSGAAGQAQVQVTFNRAAKDVSVWVGPMGSVEMTPIEQQQASVSAGGQVQVSAVYKSGSARGGLTVRVRGDFGAGLGSQIQSFVLISGPQGPAETPRDQQGKPVILVPSSNTP